MGDKRKRKEPKQQKEKKEDEEEDTTWTTVDSSKKIGQQPTFKDGVPLIFARDVDINAKNVVQKLAEIHTQRPRKESDRQNKVMNQMIISIKTLKGRILSRFLT